jgi:hypothetical protein
MGYCMYINGATGPPPTGVGLYRTAHTQLGPFVYLTDNRNDNSEVLTETLSIICAQDYILRAI